MNKAKIYKLLVSLILPIGLGSIAGIFTTKEIDVWYATLNKPSFNPPFQKDKTSCRISSNSLFAMGIICYSSQYFYLLLELIRKQKK